MHSLIISDLHLAPERPEVTRAFFDFLKTKAAQADALYIIGDLFEAWIGDDDPAQLSRDVIAQLRNLTDCGTHLYFQHGNRDFLIGNRFARETGCTLIPEHALFTINNQKVLLLHGDTLCQDDVDYQKFRRKSRRPLFKFILSHLPLKKRQKIARDWRNQSKEANSNKASNIMDVTPAVVEKTFEKYQTKTMIHGHTHRPARHQHINGERIVLGDWHKTGWMVRVDDTSIELLEFDF